MLKRKYSSGAEKPNAKKEKEESVKRLPSVVDFYQYGIDIGNCRAQIYDNASNISGKYSGPQACIKENKLA